MKIAYLIHSSAISGGIAVVCQHANRLLVRGHDVVLLSIGYVEPISWFPNQNVPIRNANKCIDNYDVLVATAWDTAFYLPLIKSKVKCYFVQSDETRFYEKDNLKQHLASLSYHLNVNFITEAKWIQEWLKINFRHNSILVPNGLDNQLYHPTQPLIPKTDRPRILLEGAISVPYKGMKEAFAAVRDLDAEIWCVSGHGVPDKSWRCDKFFEHVPMNNMKYIYSSCDILLKLSRIEGFFGPPMEMMACGGAVVVGRVTGYDEYIEDGVNALVVDPLAIDEATKAILRLIKDTNLKKSLIASGLQTAKNWNWDGSINILENHYLTLLRSEHKSIYEEDALNHNKSIVYLYNILLLNQSGVEYTIDETIKNCPPHVVKLSIFLSTNVLVIFIASAIKRLITIRKRVINYFTFKSVK
jgi:glycosyltransferase involved in cell wall biosynthesis